VHLLIYFALDKYESNNIKKKELNQQKEEIQSAVGKKNISNAPVSATALNSSSFTVDKIIRASK
jgi:hypothetical protein